MQTIHKNQLLLTKVLSGLVAGPDTEEGANRAEQNAGWAKPVPAGHGGPEPTTDGTEHGYTNENHKLHKLILARA